MHPEAALKSLPSKETPSIISEATKNAINNLCKPGILRSLWQTKNYLQFGPAGMGNIFM
jgi:hypothetical protein